MVRFDWGDLVFLVLFGVVVMVVLVSGLGMVLLWGDEVVSVFLV